MAIDNQTLDRLKKVELDILLDFDSVCRKLDINYTMSSGTLLGAIRHKGFIPWDDDIDVAMLRDDYNKFLLEGQKLLNEKYFIQTYETDKYYPYNYAKIIDTSTRLVEFSTKSIDMKKGVFIDVFPVDRTAETKFGRKLDNLYRYFILALKYSIAKEWSQQSKSTTRAFIRKILCPLAKLIGTRRLNQMETHNRIKNNKAKNIFTYADRYITPPNRIKESMLIPIEVFYKYKDVKFENYNVKSVEDHDTYLNRIYGDYMQLPPEKDRVMRHNFIELEFNTGDD